ncbi:MAG: hypothetical protein AABY93_06810 [Bacteroidota bacterium]
MKKKYLHIIISYFLVANVLLGQIVINLLHDRHDFHETVLKSETSLVTHGEHCKICSLDLLFNLLINPVARHNVVPEEILLLTFLSVDVKQIQVSFSQNRAPPIFI